MANRATKLGTFTALATGDGQECALLRDGSGVFCVEYVGTLGTFTIVLEGRAIAGSGGWAVITSKSQADITAPGTALAAAVTLMPEMRARCSAHSGGALTSITAYIIQ